MSDTQKTFFAKLSAVQAEIGTIAKDGKNPHFGNKYVTLDAITKKLVPLAAKHGLTIFQTVERDSDGKMELVTFVRDADNALIQDDIQDVYQAGITNRYPLSWDATNPQKQGSAITYARRYSLGCIFQIATEEDDDANSAAAKKSQNNWKPKQNGGYAPTKTKISPCQLNALTAEITRTKSDLDNILKYYKVASIDELTSIQASQALDFLKRKKDSVQTPANASNTKKDNGTTLSQAVDETIMMPDGSVAH